MLKIIDYDKGIIYLNPDNISELEQQIRDCKIIMNNGNIYLAMDNIEDILNNIKDI